MAACMQRAPYSVAWRTPVHAAAGCGAFQRSGPTGGAAYGMPLKVRTLPSALTTPRKIPLAVRCSTERNCARSMCGGNNMPNNRAHWPVLRRNAAEVPDMVALYPVNERSGATRMPSFEFATAARILFGEGTLRQVPAAAASVGRPALLVTGASGERAAPLRKALEAAHVSPVPSADPGEPTLDLIRSAPRDGDFEGLAEW